jgi:hypothetical protein
VGRSDFWDYPPQHVLRWTRASLTSLLERHGYAVASSMEEPTSWTAAASQIGVVRAMYRRRLNNALLRRLDLAVAWGQLLFAPSRRVGACIYVHAVRRPRVPVSLSDVSRHLHP